MAKDKIYYETCYVYEVLLIRVATSTLNFGIGKCQQIRRSSSFDGTMKDFNHQVHT